MADDSRRATVKEVVTVADAGVSESGMLFGLPFASSGVAAPSLGTVAGDVCLRKVTSTAIFAAVVAHGVTHMGGARTVLNMVVNATAEERRPLKAGGKPVMVMTGGAPPCATACGVGWGGGKVGWVLRVGGCQI
jgi:hypothetical protein